MYDRSPMTSHHIFTENTNLEVTLLDSSVKKKLTLDCIYMFIPAARMRRFSKAHSSRAIEDRAKADAAFFSQNLPQESSPEIVM
jgi:hypothetical protein